MQTALVVVLWLLTVILAAFLGYLASYMKKKGENLGGWPRLNPKNAFGCRNPASFKVRFLSRA